MRVSRGPWLMLSLAVGRFDAARFTRVTDEAGPVLSTVGATHVADPASTWTRCGWAPTAWRATTRRSSTLRLGAPGTWRVEAHFSGGAGSEEVTWTVDRSATTCDRLMAGSELVEPRHVLPTPLPRADPIAHFHQASSLSCPRAARRCHDEPLHSLAPSADVRRDLASDLPGSL